MFSPFEENFAFRRLQKSRDDLDGRALPGAVRPEIPEYFSRFYGETDVVDSRDRGIALGERVHFEHSSRLLHRVGIRKGVTVRFQFRTLQYRGKEGENM